MRWCPVALRVGLSDNYTCSGIYIADSEYEFCITLSAKLSARLKSNDNKAIGALSASLDQVIWQDLELLNEGSLHQINKKLHAFRREFAIFPDSQVSVLVFRFVDNSRDERSNSSLKPLNLMEAELRGSIIVTSSPFASAHMSLFHGYVTTGIVALIRKGLIFVDGRYLEGMEGGCVSVPNLGSIGLVAGSLIKLNGEGKLLLVIPWAVILPLIPKTVNIPFLQMVEPKPSSSRFTNATNSIVSIQMKQKPNVVSWGSGVLVASKWVLTNNHVVGEYAADKVETQIAGVVRYAKRIHRPISALDLVVLELAVPYPSQFRPITLAASEPQRGDPVHAIGYGLFAPERYGEEPKALQTTGIISNTVKGMLMTTAGCWNGSSGGALLNSDDELIGIMASNLRDNVAEEIMPDIAMSIPLSMIKQVIQKLKQLRLSPKSTLTAATVDDQYQKVWRLDRTHKDVSAKARL